MKMLVAASVGLLLAGSGMAGAQVAYTNKALDGCYAHSSTSVDTGSTVVGRDVLGTMCFDGKGKIVGSSSAPHLSGSLSNTDGTIHSGDDENWTYNVTNAPGDGMGTFEGHCTRHAFVLRNVDSNGLAHAFSYILIGRKKGCKGDGPAVIGGSGEYQGPLKQAP